MNGRLRWGFGVVGVALLLVAVFVSLQKPLARGTTVKGLAYTPFVRLCGHATVVRWGVDCRECHGAMGRLVFVAKP